MSEEDGLRASVTASLASCRLAGRRVAVALSGGVDSVTLLDVLAAAAPAAGFALSALHVHHGLSANADAWARFCADLCSRYGVPLAVQRVSVRAGGAGLEAEARAARYGCYRGLAADYVASGHHLDDQAETVLLQLLRGAGPAGLAAMPFERRLGPGAPVLLRPLLHVSREAIVAYAQQRHLAWIEDESNADLRFARNFLRAEVVPLLQERFPGCLRAIARSATNCADAAALADALGQEDLERVRTRDGLRASELLALGELRAINALRSWFRDTGVGPLPRGRLQEVLRQIGQSAADAGPQIAFGPVVLRRHRDELVLGAASRADERPAVVWRGEPVVVLADGREVRLQETPGAGVALQRIAGREVTLRARVGGERFQPDARRPRRALKKLLQESGVAPWDRGRLVLMFVGDELAWVEGLGADVSFAAGEGEPGVLPWVAPGQASHGAT
jgi:tRNA(Ile)-lysidine synthase